MISEQHLQASLSFAHIELSLYPSGQDIVAVLTGGDMPHIGCAAVAVPRHSLSGNGEISCTSSVINLLGHKDESLCRYIAEALCIRFGVAVTCTGGIHVDGIQTEQIAEIQDAVSRLLERIIT